MKQTEEVYQLSDAKYQPRQACERTNCACKLCQVSCHHIPGCLVPGDIELIAEYLDIEITDEWIQNNFRASEGALLSCNGQLSRVPTIVPANMPDGSCSFLDKQGRCSIHAVSPFGCAYSDMHMSEEDGHRVSSVCVLSQIEDKQNNGIHSQRLAMLMELGLTTSLTEFRRKRTEAELRQMAEEHHVSSVYVASQIEYKQNKDDIHAQRLAMLAELGLKKKVTEEHAEEKDSQTQSIQGCKHENSPEAS